MALGIGKNTKPADGPPYLTLSYIEAPAFKATKIEDQGRSEGLVSVINDPIQSINDQIFSTREEEVIVGNIGYNDTEGCYTSPIQLQSSNIDNDPNNVKLIYRITDSAKIDNIIAISSGITVGIINNDTFQLEAITIDTFNEKGIIKGAKLKVTVFAKLKSNVEPRNEITLDFHYLASQNFGFGVEKYFIQGTTRKSIQQTRGDIVGDQISNGFFVDTWGRAPDKIVLSGVVEMPHGLDFACRFKNGSLIQSGRQNNPTENSFIGTIEEFYRNNSNPIRVNRGEILTLNDYYKGEFYIVTFKSRSFEQSVDRPNLTPWSIELIVLARVDVNSFKGESVSSKGILNQFLNFGVR